jgi:hypothetical protein
LQELSLKIKQHMYLFILKVEFADKKNNSKYSIIIRIINKNKNNNNNRNKFIKIRRRSLLYQRQDHTIN